MVATKQSGSITTRVALLALFLVSLAAYPLPNARQLEFLELETSQFMHFNVDTAWHPPESFLHGDNPTYHNCNPSNTGISKDNQTAGYWPCLNPNIFNPYALDADKWMESAAAMGMKEVCLTARHAGGFAMWPSKFTDYGVSASSRWAATRKAQGKSIDILREFADAANKWGVKICYYINPLTDGFLSKWKQNVTAQVFMEKQKGMLTEVLTNYGPVNRLWFDGPGGSPRPAGLESAAEYKAYYDECFALIRKVSPATLTSAQRGDVCASTGSLYTNSGPAPNSTNSSECDPPSEQGEYFHPNELHGVTMQEGPDGNTAAAPTYWFWHPWVCAFNVTGCPWVGHANASRIFDGYVATVGHGGVLNMNIAPDETGLLNESVVAVMKEVGQALNDTFRLLDAVGLRGKVGNVSGPCGMGVVVLNVSDSKGDGFDYIRTMEDMRYGQRIGNYSIEYRVKGSVDWQLLVPPVHVNKTAIGQSHKGKSSLGMQDRPDGHDPRDQYVGHKRIDVPLASVPTSGSGSIRIAQVRFNCLRLIPDYNPNDESDAAPGAAGDVHVREFSLHRKVVPWEK